MGPFDDFHGERNELLRWKIFNENIRLAIFIWIAILINATQIVTKFSHYPLVPFNYK